MNASKIFPKLVLFFFLFGLYLDYTFCITTKVEIAENKIWCDAVQTILVETIYWMRTNKNMVMAGSFNTELIASLKLLTVPVYRPVLDVYSCNIPMVILHWRLNLMHHGTNVYWSYRTRYHWPPTGFVENPFVTICIPEKSAVEIWPFLWLEPPQYCPYVHFYPRPFPIHASESSKF